MSKEFSKLLKEEQSIGLMEIVKETFQAITPGLSLSKILNDVGKELKELGAQGAHELASALYRNDAFVMYPRAGQEQDNSQQAEQIQQKEVEGREM
jgi:hypothetical protein